MKPTEDSHLVLASSSTYRRALLERLRVPFSCHAPLLDESPLPGESPLATCTRLALAKAQAVAKDHPQALVIGSDQVADLDGEAISKPETHDRAVAQLRRLSARTVNFHTAVCVARFEPGFQRAEVATVRVRFRQLSDAAIERYLRLERPYDCAGSAKSEALGVALMSSIEADDPTALVGLPLTRVTTLLMQAGFDVLERAR